VFTVSINTKFTVFCILKAFYFVFCFFGLIRASLGERQVSDDEYGFSGLFATLFLSSRSL